MKGVKDYTVQERWQELENLQAEYPTFAPFLFDVMNGLMGFECSPVQIDICHFLEYGPPNRMIQAQRGQAKTTITAAYAVWRLIHDPSTRILIVSAGGTQATEIANWVIQIIREMPELACMRPDRSLGDRESVEHYDVHKVLKGPEKSPSIACVGVTSNMQGKRADILIADDIESAKNSQTQTQRERILHLTRDFTSICSTGDIIYLGTPQSIDSVYNTLPSRGYVIRIWPGRYPTKDEIENYGEHLAPSIRRAIENDPTLQTGGGITGTRGKAVDPVIIPEEFLVKKEIDQGGSYFQLQHMLDTRLSDADRYPLKVPNLVFMHISENTAPLEIFVQRSSETKIETPGAWPIQDNCYRAHQFGTEHAPFTGTYMYIDPAGGGQNGDETAYAVTKFLAGRVFLVDVGGVKGGVDEESIDALVDLAVRWKPDNIGIEKNFGYGALAAILQPKLFKQHRCGIEEVWESGQKELRILGELEAVINSGRLVVDEGLIQKDWAACERYPLEKRASYSLFFQMARITRDKDSLRHEDRLDAVAGAVRHFEERLAQDTEEIINQQRKQAWAERMRNPFGDGTPVPSSTLAKMGLLTNGHSMLARSRLRR